MVALTRPRGIFKPVGKDQKQIQDYRNKIEDLEEAMQAVYPKNWHKIKWKYTKQHRAKIKAKAMVYQSEINECKIYISLLGG